MAREYVISAGGIAVAGASTLIMIQPAAAPSSNLEILRMWASQSASNSSNQQRIQFVSQAAALPTTLTSATPAKLKRNDGVSIITGATTQIAGTCGINAATEGAGVKTVIFDDAFNVLNGWLWIPTPRETIVMPAGSVSAFALWFPVAPALLTNWAFGMVFSEIG